MNKYIEFAKKEKNIKDYSIPKLIDYLTYFNIGVPRTKGYDVKLDDSGDVKG
jgi:hypothetical protein